jgi:hypothetical protein
MIFEIYDQKPHSDKAELCISVAFLSQKPALKFVSNDRHAKTSLSEQTMKTKVWFRKCTIYVLALLLTEVLTEGDGRQHKFRFNSKFLDTESTIVWLSQAELG